jgi:type II secretory pathway pseudopilin PulG
MQEEAFARVKDRPKEAGTSLVETVMIFMIISIITAFALPAVATSIRAYNVRSAGTHIAHRLTAARSLAMTKNKNVSLSLNQETGQYGFDFTTPTPDDVADYDGGPDLTTPVPDGFPDATDPDNLSAGYYTEELPSGISVDYGDESSITVTFNSRGELPIGSAEHSIPIGDGDRTATVRVNLRGKVWVE